MCRYPASKPAATIQRRKRSVLYNALLYAVELGLLPANPVDKIQWKTPGVAETVNRRVVAGPALARALLAGVRAQGARGEHWRRSTAASTAPRPAPQKRSCWPNPTSPCRRGAGAGSTWPPPPAPAVTGATTAPPAGPAASSTAPPASRGLCLSRLSLSRCSGRISRSTGPRPTGGCSAPAAADSSRTAPTAPSGRPPAPPRSPPPSTPPPSPGAPTTSATPPCARCSCSLVLITLGERQMARAHLAGARRRGGPCGR